MLDYITIKIGNKDEGDDSFCSLNHSTPYNDGKHHNHFWPSYLYQLHLD